MNARRRWLRALGVAGSVVAAHAGSPRAAPAGDQAAFAFALIGDLPYNTLEELLLARIVASFGPGLAFAVHVGDIKGSWETCDDALLARRLALLESGATPLVYVPGDNEWTDCGSARAGSFDPNERLAWLRLRHLARLPRADGPLASLERQSDSFPGGLPENRRWGHGGVRFVTLNVPGSNNGLRADGLSVDDWKRRESLNAQWLLESYRLAAAARDAAVVVVAHANPHFEAVGSPGARAWKRDGYAGLRDRLLDCSEAFAGATLLLHGDTHRHRVQAITGKLTRVESYGSPFAHLWVRIDVDARERHPFRITTRHVDAPA